MARYGSERIRGHGIPEAIEAILIRGSRVEPRVAVLKPLSSAHLDRLRRAVRRRGPDHHDRRRVRLADRAVLSPHRRRAQDAARRRRGRRHVRDVRRARSPRRCSPSSCCCSSGSRAASIPVALASATAALPAPATSWAPARCSRCRRTPRHRARGPSRLRRGRPRSPAWSAAAADRGRLRLRGRLPAAARSTGCGGRRSAAS